jgi:hypothetical protein
MEQRNRPLTNVLLVVIILIIGAIGYVAVDTLLALRRPLDTVPAALSTQVGELAHPTPTLRPDPVTIVLEVRALSRLESASYTVEKVITAEVSQGALSFLLGDRLLLVAHGRVIAGVDLAKMGDGDIRVAGDTVYVTMPAAEVFVATLDNDKTYVYDRSTGLLGPAIDLETQARQVAESEILNAALEDGILDMAQTNAEIYVRGLILSLGYQEVVFIVGTPMPTPSPSGG